MKTFARTLFTAFALSSLASSGAALAQEGGGGGRGKLFEACKDDLEKHCKAVEAGRGGRMRCLREKEKEISAGCKEALAKAEERWKQRQGEGKGPHGGKGPQGGDKATPAK